MNIWAQLAVFFLLFINLRIKAIQNYIFHARIRLWGLQRTDGILLVELFLQETTFLAITFSLKIYSCPVSFLDMLIAFFQETHRVVSIWDQTSYLLQSSWLGILFKNYLVIYGIFFFAERCTMTYFIFSLARLKPDKKISTHAFKNMHLGGSQKKKVGPAQTNHS